MTSPRRTVITAPVSCNNAVAFDQNCGFYYRGSPTARASLYDASDMMMSLPGDIITCPLGLVGGGGLGTLFSLVA